MRTSLYFIFNYIYFLQYKILRPATKCGDVTVRPSDVLEQPCVKDTWWTIYNKKNTGKWWYYVFPFIKISMSWPMYVRYIIKTESLKYHINIFIIILSFRAYLPFMVRSHDQSRSVSYPKFNLHLRWCDTFNSSSFYFHSKFVEFVHRSQLNKGCLHINLSSLSHIAPYLVHTKYDLSYNFHFIIR